MNIFDHMVSPILTYGCEIWGYENCQVLESLHLGFCKYILGVKRSTPTPMVYGQPGRNPIEIVIKTKLLCFWHTRILIGKESKLSHLIYVVLYKLYNSGVYGSSWLKY